MDGDLGWNGRIDGEGFWLIRGSHITQGTYARLASLELCKLDHVARELIW